ncbi:MAG: DUF305 domain-containing protein [Myxococcota bacterium]
MSIHRTLLGAAVISLGLLLGAAPSGGPGAAGQPAGQAFMQAAEKMNREMMAKPMVGDADADFASIMIAHHQGAIDMANVELQYGKDPELRAVAQKVIDDQTKEIESLQRWQKGRTPVQ